MAKKKAELLAETISIPADHQTKAALERLARREDRKPAQMGRILIKEALAARQMLGADAARAGGDHALAS